jgi:hypothetical protein
LIGGSGWDKYPEKVTNFRQKSNLYLIILGLMKCTISIMVLGFRLGVAMLAAVSAWYGAKKGYTNIRTLL